ncbi:MAG: purine-nucleoside phosphorylase [Eubacteriales bacterium]|nr:purine-nucleoside phosphorylase [Eubacteriales bacterium]
MMKIPTPHIEATRGEIAETVLMPGDPLRAKFIAEHYLKDARCFNRTRNMFGFTGTYGGKRVSVMGSGMGMPSMGIYAYELYHGHDVQRIIRIGTAGGLAEDVAVGDLVIAQAACTNGNFADQFDLPGIYAPIASFDLSRRLADAAAAHDFRVKVGNVLSSDTFYSAREDELKRWAEMHVLAVEMEAAALFMTATAAGKEAAAMCTISDLPFTGASMDARDREQSLTDMIETALSVI